MGKNSIINTSKPLVKERSYYQEDIQQLAEHIDELIRTYYGTTKNQSAILIDRIKDTYLLNKEALSSTADDKMKFDAFLKSAGEHLTQIAGDNEVIRQMLDTLIKKSKDFSSKDNFNNAAKESKDFKDSSINSKDSIDVKQLISEIKQDFSAQLTQLKQGLVVDITKQITSLNASEKLNNKEKSIVNPIPAVLSSSNNINEKETATEFFKRSRDKAFSLCRKVTASGKILMFSNDQLIITFALAMEKNISETKQDNEGGAKTAKLDLNQLNFQFVDNLPDFIRDVGRHRQRENKNVIVVVHSKQNLTENTYNSARESNCWLCPVDMLDMMVNQLKNRLATASSVSLSGQQSNQTSNSNVNAGNNQINNQRNNQNSDIKEPRKNETPVNDSNQTKPSVNPASNVRSDQPKFSNTDTNQPIKKELPKDFPTENKINQNKDQAEQLTNTDNKNNTLNEQPNSAQTIASVNKPNSDGEFSSQKQSDRINSSFEKAPSSVTAFNEVLKEDDVKQEVQERSKKQFIP